MICRNCNAQVDETKNFCPSCGTSMVQRVVRTSLPEGQELLNGLYVVQDYLKQINGMMVQFAKMEGLYRQRKHTELEAHAEKITNKTLKEKTEYGLFVSGIAIAVVLSIISLLSGQLYGVFGCLVVTVIFAIGRVKRNKLLLRVGGFMLIMLFWTWFKGLIGIFTDSNKNLLSEMLYLFINIAAFAAAAFVASKLIKKYNQRIHNHNQKVDQRNRGIEMADNAYNDRVKQHNEALDQERQQLSDNIVSLTDKMMQKTSFWFPVDYYILDCVEHFIKIVRNHEADTVKEMLKIYKEDAYRTEVLHHQSEMEVRFEQSLTNQQQMIQLQKVSNMIQMANMVVNMTTAYSVNKIKKNTDAIKHDVNRAANAAESIQFDVNRTANKVTGSDGSALRIVQAAEEIARNRL